MPTSEKNNGATMKTMCDTHRTGWLYARTKKVADDLLNFARVAKFGVPALHLRVVTRDGNASKRRAQRAG
jgi:hypothetical protein